MTAAHEGDTSAGSEKVTISLPKKLLKAAQEAWPGHYASFSAYIQDLIRKHLESRSSSSSSPTLLEPGTYHRPPPSELSELAAEIRKLVSTLAPDQLTQRPIKYPTARQAKKSTADIELEKAQAAIRGIKPKNAARP